MGGGLHVANVCGCFLDEDGEESIHGLFYVDLLPGVKEFLDQLENVLNKQGLTRAQQVQYCVTVLIDDVGNELRMVFIYLSELGNAVVAEAPTVALDVGFDQVA